MSLSDMMNKLKRIKAEIASGRRVSYYSDPSKGLEYNEINPNKIVSRRIYRTDMARSPQVVKGSPTSGFIRVDVQAEARLVNYQRPMIDYYVHKAKGRI